MDGKARYNEARPNRTGRKMNSLNKLAVTKQSMVDWQVTLNGASAAWIRKAADGTFIVTTRGDNVPFFATSFKEAKEMAYRLAVI